jgi:hypothetical protein
MPSHPSRQSLAEYDLAILLEMLIEHDAQVRAAPYIAFVYQNSPFRSHAVRNEGCGAALAVWQAGCLHRFDGGR